MPRERSEAARLFDMQQAAQTALRYVAGRTREEYEVQDMLRHAVERNLEIIGEAARGLSSEFREQNPQVPWRAIMSTRHILAHEYEAVDNDIVWRILQEHLPELVRQLKPLIPEAPDEVDCPP